MRASEYWLALATSERPPRGTGEQHVLIQLTPAQSKCGNSILMGIIEHPRRLIRGFKVALLAAYPYRPVRILWPSACRPFNSELRLPADSKSCWTLCESWGCMAAHN